MHFTKEQQLVLDHITKLRETKQDEVLLINAVAGAAVTKRTAVVTYLKGAFVCLSVLESSIAFYFCWCYCTYLSNKD